MCLFNQVPVVQKVDRAIHCIVQLVLLIGFIQWIALSSFWTAGARTLRRWNRLTTRKMFLFFNRSISQYKIFRQLNPISLPAERSSINLDDKKMWNLFLIPTCLHFFLWNLLIFALVLVRGLYFFIFHQHHFIFKNISLT